MLRNDYRRALIMLRAVERGYSGHARLERRTLMGTLAFSVCAPQGDQRLEAALVGRKSGDHFAAALGRLRRDSRGQYALNATFDPRKIAGRELDAYSLVVIVAAEPGICRLVLAGNLNGSVEVDWGRVRQAACSLYELRPGVPVPQPRADDASANKDYGLYSSGDPAPSDAENTAAPNSDAEIKDSGLLLASEDETAADGAGTAVALPRVQASDAGDKTDDGLNLAGEGEEDVFPDPLGEAEAAQEAQAADAPQASGAGAASGLDMTRPWPEAFAGLQSLFLGAQIEADAPLEGYAFVRAPLAEGSGYPYVLIGLQAEDGVPVRVAYAFPGIYAPQPPAGLEDCAWVVSGGQGWWLRS